MGIREKFQSKSANQRDDVSKIKKWLKSREVDEEDGAKVHKKTPNSVLTQMARDIKQIKPLPIGECGICSIYSEGLVPMILKVCWTCVKKFTKKGAGLKVLKRDLGPHWCDSCLKKSIRSFTINIRMCRKCIRKHGKHHNKNLEDMKKKQAKEMKERRITQEEIGITKFKPNNINFKGRKVA